MLLVVDNGSVYTKHLVEFLLNKKIKFTQLSPIQVPLSELSQFDSIILSGRRKNNQKMNAINSKLIKHAISQKKPLLGICYGAEILALTLGGTIRKMPTPHKGEEKVTILQKNSLCQGKIRVFESHNYEISRLGNSCSGIGKSSNCLYELIQYNDLNVFGTQFHPEMSTDGKAIIENFLSL